MTANPATHPAPRFLLPALVAAVLLLPAQVQAQDRDGSWFLGGGVARFALESSTEVDGSRSSGTERASGGEVRLGWRGERHRFYGSLGTFRAEDSRLLASTLTADVFHPLNDFFKLMAGGSLVFASQNWDQGERDRAYSGGLGFQIGVLMPVSQRLEVELSYRQLFTRLRTSFDNEDGDRERFTGERVGSTHLHLNFLF